MVDIVMSLRFDGRCSSEWDLLRRLRGSCVGLAGVALTAVGVCWLGEVGGVDVCCAVRAGAMLSAKVRSARIEYPEFLKKRGDRKSVV